MDDHIFQLNYVDTSTAKPYDILKPERALVKFVCCNTECNIRLSCYCSVCSRVQTDCVLENAVC
jgi:hypothetical protein